MKQFKVQFLNKSGSIQEKMIQAENEVTAKKDVSDLPNYDIIICCKLV